MAFSIALCFTATTSSSHDHHHLRRAAAASSTPTPPFPPPLHRPALTRLGAGSIKPLGWLLDELNLQAKGISGQLPFFWHYLNWTDWMGTGKDPYGREGGAPRQFLPYYLNGLIPLSYQVDDPNLVMLRHRYMTHILATQMNASGGSALANTSTWLGPAVTNPLEYMTKYDAVEAVESHVEGLLSRNASREEVQPILDALVAHHRAFFDGVRDSNPNFNQSKWGVSRYSDAIVGIQWLIDQLAAAAGGGGTSGSSTNIAVLLDLQERVRSQADAVMESVAAADGGGYSWEQWFERGDPFTKASDGEKTHSVHLRRHGVDIGEAQKTGALLWRASGATLDLENSYTALMWANEKYLHMADGMFFADEEVTYGGGNTTHNGGHTAGRGTETCSVVEAMFSMRTAYEITGNITFMDRLERIAFNALPAALWPDVTANVYHHRSNQLSCGGEYGYSLHYCCTANVHQGWPKFVLSAVQLRSEEEGAESAAATVVISGYAPSRSVLPDGTVVTISGRYPFADWASITVDRAVPSLSLRIPCWTEGATIVTSASNTTNVSTTVAAAVPCAFHSMSITASGGATMNVTFQNEIKIYTWVANKTDGSYSGNCGSRGGPPCGTNGGGVEVHRGALTFALRPNSSVITTTVGCIGGQPQGRYSWNCSGADVAFPAIKARQVAVTTTPGSDGNWSYGLIVKSLKFIDDGVATPLGAVPFDTTTRSPVRIVVQARNLNLGSDGNTKLWTDSGLLPHSPLVSDAPLEELELVPFGMTNIRIAVLPQLNEGGE